jgi:hypothetical protein
VHLGPALIAVLQVLDGLGPLAAGQDAKTQFGVGTGQVVAAVIRHAH